MLEVSGFQIDDSAIFTIKEGAELLASGVAPAAHHGEYCNLLFGGLSLRCHVETREYGPEKVGSGGGQTRYYWRGTVVEAKSVDAAMGVG